MRPRTVVNVAMSADGKLSTRERRQVKISGKEDFLRVDRLKAECDAVMVGIGTVLADDPSLTVKDAGLKELRHSSGMDEHPVRVVIDSTARTPPDASVLTKGSGKRVVAVSCRAKQEQIAQLRTRATVIVAGEKEVDLATVMDELGTMGISRVMVEGGGTLIAALFAAGLVDEVYTFVGNIIIGGKDAPTLADGVGCVKESEFTRLALIDAICIDDGILLHWDVVR
ncbi:MAG: 2,5-diamino-6-(ribosylamino)-4(3H)-pyrimidinone 5'-phosphate reductase [Methanoregula sp.]|nr:2,5-diamino-6-(ribosylamino)-4(3H)-pyrimidinone 5'-phosphate reductase [Methanoregula sp.]